jgi:hypothetical protein
MDLLVLHSTGIGWDEALVVLGGLAALTLVALTRLGRAEPATEEAQPDIATRASAPATRRKR